MGRYDGLKKGKRFSSEYQPEKNGRKPSKLKEYIKENNIGQKEVSDLIKNLVFEHNIDELEEMANDRTKPFIITSLLTAFLKDIERGTIYNTNPIMDRAIGKPKERIEHSGELTVTQMTREERQARIKELEDKRKKDNVDS